MTQAQYIEEVAKYVKKYAPQYGIKVYSPIIAQFCLESGYGTTNKVKKILENGTIDWRHNYVGLKWRNGRCAISNEYFEEGTSEQNKDGTYTNITSKFYRFKNLEECVIGYFQFTNISTYSNLKGVTDPETYLKNIKEDKFATSIDYVQKNMNVIKKWNLTKYDVREESKMSYKVAIDAGHGSNTAGKRTVSGYREHWCNVKTANYFDIAMKRCGLETVRIGWNDTNSTDDTDVSLTTRQKQIKNAKCDISVSWHANAHGDGKTYTSGQGIETLIHNNPARVGDSKALADKVQAQLIKGTSQKNRGVKPMSLSMCNCEAMGTKASILIEIAFMTNQHEEQLIQTDAFCLECAEEAAMGVCEYLGVAYKANNGSSTSTNITPSTTTTTYSYTLNQFVKDIQKAIGVTVDGIVGAQTLAKLPTVSKTKNNKHAVVKPLQKYLNSLGFNCGTVDGNAGAKFDVAAKAWAKANSCTMDGEFTAGGKSWKVILGYNSTSTYTSTNTSTTSSNSVNYTYKGVNYSLVFNPTYYSNKYPDLKKAFGTNATKLFSHFCEHGVKEGRQAIDSFNVEVYKNNYTDLRNAFGNDLPKYYEHYIQYGYKEGRRAK